jgi:hypothetical protein
MPIPRAVEKIEEEYFTEFFQRRQFGEAFSNLVTSLARKLAVQKVHSVVAHIYVHKDKGVNHLGNGEKIAIVHKDSSGNHYLSVNGKTYLWNDDTEEWKD